MPSNYMPTECLRKSSESPEHVNGRNCQDWEAAYIIANLSGRILAVEPNRAPISPTEQTSIPPLSKDVGQPLDCSRQKQVKHHNFQIDQNHSRPLVHCKYKNEHPQHEVLEKVNFSSGMYPVSSRYPNTPHLYGIASVLPQDCSQEERCVPSIRISASDDFSSRIHPSYDYQTKAEIEKSNNFEHFSIKEKSRRMAMKHNLFPSNFDRGEMMTHEQKTFNSNERDTFSTENGNCSLPHFPFGEYAEQSKPPNTFGNVSQYDLNLKNNYCGIRSESTEESCLEIVEMEVEDETERLEVASDRGGRFVRTTILVEDGTNDQPINLSRINHFHPLCIDRKSAKKHFKSLKGSRQPGSCKTAQTDLTNEYDAYRQQPYASPKMTRLRNTGSTNSQKNHNLHILRDVKDFNVQLEFDKSERTSTTKFSLSFLSINQADSKNHVALKKLEHVHSKKDEPSINSKGKSLSNWKVGDDYKVNNYNAIRDFKHHQLTEIKNACFEDETKQRILDVDHNRSVSQLSEKNCTITTQNMPMKNSATKLNIQDLKNSTQLALPSPGLFLNRRAKSSTNLSMTFKVTNPEIELEKVRSGKFGTLQSIRSFYSQLDSRTTKSLNPLDLSMNTNDQQTSRDQESLTKSATSNVSVLNENKCKTLTNLFQANNIDNQNRLSTIHRDSKALQVLEQIASDKVAPRTLSDNVTPTQLDKVTLTLSDKTAPTLLDKMAPTLLDKMAPTLENVSRPCTNEISIDNSCHGSTPVSLRSESTTSKCNTKLNDLHAMELATSQLNVKDDTFLQVPSKSASGSANLPDCQLPPKKRRMFDHCKTGIWQSETCEVLKRVEAEEEQCLNSNNSNKDVEMFMMGDEQSACISVDHLRNINLVQVADKDVPAGVRLLLAAGQPDEDGDLPLHLAVVQGMSSIVERLLFVMRRFGVSIDYCNHLKQTPLHLAFITNNCNIVRTLLTEGASMTRTDRQGNGLLHLAVQCGSIDCLRLVFEDDIWKKRGLDVNALNYEGFTALHLAVQKHELEALAILLDSGRANVNSTDGKNGRTSLYFAAESNDLHAARILLAHNADVHALTYSGCSAMQMANERSHFELLKLIERKETIMKH